MGHTSTKLVHMYGTYGGGGGGGGGNPIFSDADFGNSKGGSEKSA